MRRVLPRCLSCLCTPDIGSLLSVRLWPDVEHMRRSTGRVPAQQEQQHPLQQYQQQQQQAGSLLQPLETPIPRVNRITDTMIKEEMEGLGSGVGCLGELNDSTFETVDSSVERLMTPEPDPFGDHLPPPDRPPG